MGCSSSKQDDNFSAGAGALKPGVAEGNANLQRLMEQVFPSLFGQLWTSWCAENPAVSKIWVYLEDLGSPAQQFVAAAFALNDNGRAVVLLPHELPPFVGPAGDRLGALHHILGAEWARFCASAGQAGTGHPARVVGSLETPACNLDSSMVWDVAEVAAPPHMGVTQAQVFDKWIHRLRATGNDQAALI